MRQRPSPPSLDETPYDAHFSARSRERGRRYYQAGLVVGLAAVGQRFFATVLGTRPYEVHLVLPAPDEPTRHFEHGCDCPAWARNGECKHVYAVLLDVLSSSAVSASDRVLAHELERFEEGEGAGTHTGADGSVARAALRSVVGAPSGGVRASGLRELRHLMERASRASDGDVPAAAQLELGLRLEVPGGSAIGGLNLRPVVARRIDLDPGLRRELGLDDELLGCPRDPSAATWRPFEHPDAASLTDGSTDVLHVLEETIVLGQLWGRERRWDSGLGDVLLIQDAALPILAALLEPRGALLAPTPKPGTHGPSGPLLVERDPFVFRLRRIVDAAGSRLTGVLEREGVVRELGIRDADGAPTLHPLASANAANADVPTTVLASQGHVLVGDRRLVPIATDGASDAWQRIVLTGPVELDDSEDEREELIHLAEIAGSKLDGVDLPALESCEPRPCLRIDGPRTWWPASKLPCSIAFSYGGREVQLSDRSRRVIVAGDARYERDHAAERARFDEALENGLNALPDVLEGEGDDAWVAPRRLDGVVRRFLELGWKVEADGQRFREPGETSASVTSGVDWFGVRGELRFDGATVSLPDVLRAARKGESWIELGDGSRGLLPADWLERWQWLEMGREGEDAEVRFGRQQGWLIDALLSTRGPVDADAGFRRFVERLERFDRIEPKKAPATFRGELRAYQREGLGWFAYLEKLGVGGCLADDMGLGKTVQVLAWLEARRKRRAPKGEERRPSLVVVPRSLLFNWKDEAARFTPKMRVALHHGPKRKRQIDETFAAHLVVTTYGTLRRDAALFEDQPFDAVVLDEAQAIKNERSQSSKAVRLLDARQRVALSGTPVENRIDELWALFEFLNPGMLGTVPAFKRLLSARAFEGEAGPDGEPERAVRSVSEANAEADAEAEANAEPADPDDPRRATVRAIGRAIRPFFLRRTKSEVLTDLPEKTEQVIQVELPAKQRKAYDEAAGYYRAQLLGAQASDNGEPLDAMSVLTALLRLRQLACHPGLVDADRSLEPSGKLDELIPMLVELVGEGHKAVVFSQFTSLLDLVAARLDNEDLSFEVLTGGTRNRRARVERFQNDPQVPLFLVSLKAGGTGLNLTAADYVFLLDPWWNPAAEAQAIDRAHRIGRTRPVHAYRLVARDTIESRVLELQAEKRELAASLMDGAASSVSDVRREDLRVLLGG